MDKQEEIREIAEDLGIPSPLAKRLAMQAMGYEDAVLKEIERIAEIPTKEGESKYLQIKKTIGEVAREAHRVKKAEEADIKQAQLIKEYERGKERGFVASKKQLEDQVADLYDSDQILDYAPRNIPQELREDPVALKAKLLEWGIKGASLVHEMIGIEPPAEKADDDIPF